MGDNNSVLPISGNVKKMFVDRCHKTGHKQIHVVDELVTKWLSGEVDDSEVKVASHLKIARSCIDQINEVKALFDSVQVYDGWSVSTEERTIQKLREKGVLDEAYIERLKRVYSLGREKIKTAEEEIDKALDVLTEEKPKQLGKTLDEWRKAHQKPECRHLLTKLAVVRGDRRMRRCLDCGLEIWENR